MPISEADAAVLTEGQTETNMQIRDLRTVVKEHGYDITRLRAAR